MSAKIHLAYAWTCRDCEATGDTDASAEKHAKSGHTVWSKAVPS